LCERLSWCAALVGACHGGGDGGVVDVWRELCAAFPWGEHLADGGYKSVFRVYNAQRDSMEAISVMNAKDLGREGTTILVQEMLVSYLLHDLVRRDVCPNFVDTLQVLRCSHAAPKALWGGPEKPQPQGSFEDFELSEDFKAPRKPRTAAGASWVLLRMELCEGGDVEEYLRSHGSVEVGTVVAWLFQMFFSLHVAHDALGLVHYDVKCLNFFLKRWQSTPEEALAESGEDDETEEGHPAELQYGWRGRVYSLPEAEYLIKLADFGTATMPADRSTRQVAAEAVTAQCYTTVENAPLEFLLQGSDATQGSAADVYQMGLCFLHLLTGEAPYEEVLESVRCPEGLAKQMCEVWGNHACFEVLRESLGLTVGSKRFMKDATVACDTVYRMVVLFGMGSKVPGPLWPVVDAFLRRDGAKQFKADQSRASLEHGTLPAMVRARAMLEKMPGGMELLRRCVAFEGTARATVEDALQSSVFDVLRVDPSCRGDGYFEYI